MLSVQTQNGSDKMDKESEERVLKILSNPIRATIVRNLHKDKLSFTHLMQITGCKTGQLSFHLKKLDYLVEQDELKRYKLSDNGTEHAEAILPRLERAEHNVSEDVMEVSFAFRLFVESLMYLISCCIFAVKYITIHSWKRFVGICYWGTESIKNIIGNSSSRFGVCKPFWRRATENAISFSRRLRQMTDETANSLKSLVVVAAKCIKRSINPMFSYSLIVVGLMLFIPAVFISASSGFDPILNSVADVDTPHLSDDQIAQANQLYEKGLLPYQSHYQGDYNFTLYNYMNYITKVGYPLTTKKIEAWQKEHVERMIQFVEDSLFAALSISSVMILIGGLLAFEKKMLLKRFLLSTVFASVLLLLVSVILLLGISIEILTDFNQITDAISSVTFLLKSFIGMLLLIIFSFSGLFIYLKTMKKNQFP